MTNPVADDEIERRFTYHPPTDEVVRAAHDEVRAMVKEFARQVNERLAPGRESALFFTALEEASFWCHADIARNGVRADHPLRVAPTS